MRKLVVLSCALFIAIHSNGSAVGQFGPAGVSYPSTAVSADNEVETKIRKALSKRVTFQVHEKPLASLLNDLAKELGVEIQIDRTALEAVGLAVDTPATLVGNGITARSALEIMLQALDLNWTIAHEVLWITTVDGAEQLLKIKVYDVADLVAETVSSASADENFNFLIDMLTSTVAPVTWDDVGGAGSCQPFNLSGVSVLVVSQVREVHEQIETLLADVRSKRHGAAPAIDGDSTGPTPATSRVLRDTWPDCFGPGTSATDSTNFFATAFCSELRQNQPGNMLICPYGIASVLEIAHVGARGETAEELRYFLGAPVEADVSHVSARALLDAVTQPKNDTNKFLAVNRIWVNQRADMLPAYVDAAARHYRADLVEFDFHDTPALASAINQWVKQHTLGEIPRLVEPSNLSNAPLQITNAVYFRGKWERPFDRNRTVDGSFHSPKKVVPVQMMQMVDRSSRYGKVSDVQILEKRYVGKDFSLVILLPEEGREAFERLEAELAGGVLSGWLKRLRTRELEIHLPRFTVRSQSDLATAFQRFGLEVPFQSGKADFSGMNGRHDLFLSSVTHASIIEVDEQGTEAAAATQLGFGIGSATQPTVFKADHPFIYLIRHNPTDTILFIGVLEDPSEPTASVPPT